jgi:hypothetical protein
MSDRSGTVRDGNARIMTSRGAAHDLLSMSGRAATEFGSVASSPAELD